MWYVLGWKVGSEVGSGANVIKLFLFVIFGFSDKARVFVRLDWKKLTNDKHSSLLRKSVIYGQKSFITLGPGLFKPT
jgi:hypothetical protein